VEQYVNVSAFNRKVDPHVAERRNMQSNI